MAVAKKNSKKNPVKKKAAAKRKPPVKNIGTQTVSNKNNQAFNTDNTINDLQKAITEFKNEIQGDKQVGKMYLITEAEKNKMVKAVQTELSDMALGAFLFAGACLFVGFIFGYKNGVKDTEDFVKTKYRLIPKY